MCGEVRKKSKKGLKRFKLSGEKALLVLGAAAVVAVVAVLLLRQGEKAELAENVTALNNLGVYYAEKGDLDKAVGYFKKVLEIDLSHETARKNLALLYFKQGRYEKAIEHFTLLTKFRPGNPMYHYDLAISIAENCRRNNICYLEKAIEEFERAEKLQPGYEKAAQNAEALRAVLEEMRNESLNDSAPNPS